MQELKEEWRDIPGYEGLYQASTHGRIKSLPRVVIRRDGKPYPQKEYIMGVRINHWGYHTVRLTDYNGANHQRQKMVHKLVALTFIPNPNDYPQINHKDCDKSNNRPENLEWCNNSMNQKHAWANGLNRYTGKLDKKIVQMDVQGNQIKVWNSLNQAARSLDKVSVGHLWAVLNGKRHTCGGYKWKYYE